MLEILLFWQLVRTASRYRRLPCRPLFNECCSLGLPCVLMMAYAADGDNVADAVGLVQAVSKLLPKSEEAAEPRQWQMPSSWSILLSPSPMYA